MSAGCRMFVVLTVPLPLGSTVTDWTNAKVVSRPSTHRPFASFIEAFDYADEAMTQAWIIAEVHPTTDHLND